MKETINLHCKEATKLPLILYKTSVKPKVPGWQMLDSTFYWINHYSEDKYWKNQLSFSLDRDLSCGYRYPPFQQLGPED